MPAILPATPRMLNLLGLLALASAAACAADGPGAPGDVADTVADAEGSGDTTPDADAPGDTADETGADAPGDTADETGADADADGSGNPDPGPAPLAPGAPWPRFRADSEQTGAAPFVTADDRGVPWVFETGKGIFSSPVISADGTIFVGSADRTFYALRPDGTERWRFVTGEIIDSAAVLDDTGGVYFGSGDGFVYALDAATGAERWRFAADAPGPRNSIINWFEGNVTLGPGGTLLAGNDNFFVYAIDRATGRQQWRAPLPDQTWSAVAYDRTRQRYYVGNNNLTGLTGNLFSFDLSGRQKWVHRGRGTVAASPVVLPGGAVVVGAYDGYVRAFDGPTGRELWSFATRDHIYASPAYFAADNLLVQPSADGTVYGLDATTGAQRWAFDWGAPIRSSPAVDADGTSYVGTGDGHLLVLNRDGALRWAYRLIESDRDDLNASPALTPGGVVIAGETGQVFFVPADYCRRPSGVPIEGCSLVGREPLPDEGIALRFVSPFGNALDDDAVTALANQPITFELVVRRGGDSVLAFIDPGSLEVSTAPAAEFAVAVSPDRRHVTLTPTSRWPADASGAFEVALNGQFLEDAERDGLQFSGGNVAGTWSKNLRIPLRDPGVTASPAVPSAPGEPAQRWIVERLAVPLPTLLPSYNQIGFDSLWFTVTAVEENPAGLVTWFSSATRRPDGSVVPDAAAGAGFAMATRVSDGLITMQNQGGMTLEVMSATLSFASFRISAALGDSLSSGTTASVVASGPCGSIELYGPFLRTLGLCNPDTDELVALGAANLVPAAGGGTVTGPGPVGPVVVSRADPGIVATFESPSLRASEHAFGLALIDAATGIPVSSPDLPRVAVAVDADGRAAAVSLDVGGVPLPAALRVYLMVDGYPVARGLAGN